MISAAQVAYYYGGYTLDTAVALSRDEKELLLAVAFSDQERQWDRFERILGTSWDLFELANALDIDGSKAKAKDKNAEPVQLQRTVRIPLLIATAPEFFKHLTDEYRKKYRSLMETTRKTGGGQVVEIGTLSSAQARDLYRQLDGILNDGPPKT